jgi:hypothetical protein
MRPPLGSRRGASAKGFFEVTHDVSHLSCADFLRAPGVQTPVIVRFSTVIHERGSPETLRDPRGFAVKFYTREGNFDMVGNNMPVFFIRDGMKFPDMVHALKPNPKNHIQVRCRCRRRPPPPPRPVPPLGTRGTCCSRCGGIGAAADTRPPAGWLPAAHALPTPPTRAAGPPPSPTQEGWRIADFFSHHPEACNMFAFLLDDVGIPLNYRHMEGFGALPLAQRAAGCSKAAAAGELPAWAAARCPPPGADSDEARRLLLRRARRRAHHEAAQQGGQGDAGQVPLEAQVRRQVPAGGRGRGGARHSSPGAMGRRRAGLRSGSSSHCRPAGGSCRPAAGRAASRWRCDAAGVQVQLAAPTPRALLPAQVGGTNHSHATKDLYDAIAAGDYPEVRGHAGV